MIRLSCLLLALLLAGCASPPRSGASVSSFVFSDWAGPAIRVHTAGPAIPGPDTRVVFVLHGVGRNAQTYRDNWTGLAGTHGLLVLVPEFTQADFPGAGAYNLGGITPEQPQSQGAYRAIEAIFDAVRERQGLQAQTYALFGHSAGAQFVHRFACFEPAARFDIAIAANAGWYTMPDPDIAWPYGLGGVGQGCDPATWLARPLVILLGEADNDPDHSSLRRTPEASAQGPHRFARGLNFFRSAQRTAADQDLAFSWHLATVPGVAHDNAGMARAAASRISEARPR